MLIITVAIGLILYYMDSLPAKPTPGVITSPYGYRKNPYPGATGQQFHGGIDVAWQKKSQPVYATYSGKVIVSSNSGSTTGLRIWIKKDNSDLHLLFAHLSKSYVSVGQHVQKGDLIGMTGNSGATFSGIHLHYAERVGGTSVTYKDRNPVEVANLYK